MIPVKICGVTDAQAAWAATCAGAAFVGFVFHPASPRAVTPEEAAAIARDCAGQVKTVALFVDPADADLQAVFDAFSPDMIQLHGAEAPDRVAWIRAHAGRPVIKALGVAQASDIAAARIYEDVADWILFDAKPAGGGVGGGRGVAFDWNLLKDYKGTRPWMLSGGLNARTVAAALALCKPDAIDLSSGVEDAPGRKNPDLIHDFFEELARIG